MLDNGCDERVSFKLPVQESTDLRTTPTARMDKGTIQGEITFVKIMKNQPISLRAADRHVENGQVEKGHRLMVISNKRKRFPGLIN